MTIGCLCGHFESCPNCNPYKRDSYGKPLTVREQARRHLPLDGADAQALEHAITITERERDALKAELDSEQALHRITRAGAEAIQADNERLQAEVASLKRAGDVQAVLLGQQQLAELREAAAKFLVTPYSADSQREFRAALAKVTP